MKTKNSNSLMAKNLNEELENKLEKLRTKTGFTLKKAINSGIKNLDSSIGIYAGDEETYQIFSEIFNPIIKEYHNFAENDLHCSDFELEKFGALDKEHKYIISTRIRVARNLKKYPLGTNISYNERQKVEDTVKECLLNLEGDLKGTYYSLSDICEEERKLLIKNHFLFKEGDRFLEAAGLNRDFPQARGIFLNQQKTFLLWVNEEDHLRIISMEEHGDISSVFSRLKKALLYLENTLDFSFNRHHGYISTCPSNLGTAMRASVHIRLTKLGNNMELFKYLTDKYELQIRGVDGEHSKSRNYIFDISNKRRLGLSEKKIIEGLYLGVKKLIEEEEKL